MLRIELTAEDLVRVRFEMAPGPLVDVGQASPALRRRPVAPLAHWHTATAPRVDRRVHPLLALTPPTGTTCGFVEPLCPDLATGLERARAAPTARMRLDLADLPGRGTPWLLGLAGGDREARADLMAAISRLYAAGVAPVAQQLAADREADVARRAADLAAEGLRATVARLHRTVRINGRTLTWTARSRSRTARTGWASSWFRRRSWSTRCGSPPKRGSRP